MAFDIQIGLPTFTALNNTATGTIAANTRRDIISLDHPVTSIKRMRILRIEASFLATTAVASDLRIYLYRGVLQATAGTITTSQPKSSEFSAADTVFRIAPTITAATLQFTHIMGNVPATANSVIARQIIYERTMAGKEEDYTLREGFVQGFAIAIQNTGVNVNWTPFVTVTYLEE